MPRSLPHLIGELLLSAGKVRLGFSLPSILPHQRSLSESLFLCLSFSASLFFSSSPDLSGHCLPVCLSVSVCTSLSPSPALTVSVCLYPSLSPSPALTVCLCGCGKRRDNFQARVMLGVFCSADWGLFCFRSAMAGHLIYKVALPRL